MWPQHPATHSLQGSPETSSASAHAVGPPVPGPSSWDAPEPRVPLRVLRTDSHGAPDGTEPPRPGRGAGRGTPTQTPDSSRAGRGSCPKAGSTSPPVTVLRPSACAWLDPDREDDHCVSPRAVQAPSRFPDSMHGSRARSPRPGATSENSVTSPRLRTRRSCRWACVSGNVCRVRA